MKEEFALLAKPTDGRTVGTDVLLAEPIDRRTVGTDVLHRYQPSVRQSVLLVQLVLLVNIKSYGYKIVRI